MNKIIPLKRKSAIKSNNTVLVRGQGIELSPEMIKKFEAEANKLMSYLHKNNLFSSINAYLNDLAGLSCGNQSFQDELLSWGFPHLATNEGFAWLEKNYSGC